VLCARDDELNMTAMLLHYTCHPVNVFAQPGYCVSADWPGAWAAAMREMFGVAAEPLVLNGCCGNINPWPPFEPDFVPDHRRMGRALGDSARAVVKQMRFADADCVDWKVRRIPIPLKPADPDRLAAAQRMLAEHPAPLWSTETPGLIDPTWFQAASVMSVELMRKRSPDLLYEIQVMRVGDVAFVGLPGEPFVEGQLAIKLASPAYYTFVAHATTQYVGYLPTREAHKRGGHEVDFSYWAKLCPEALDRVVDNAVELLRDLFP
jgi:neutral ceramidase